MVDGGQPQVEAVAAPRSSELAASTDVALCGLAKRLEEVWLPGEDLRAGHPAARTSREALYLLQRVRDEAHRFAITFHRERRSKRMTKSALDTVPGLGETRRKALLRHFGSVKRLAEATPEQITEVPGIGRAPPRRCSPRSTLPPRAGRRRPGPRGRAHQGGRQPVPGRSARPGPVRTPAESGD